MSGQFRTLVMFLFHLQRNSSISSSVSPAFTKHCLSKNLPSDKRLVVPKILPTVVCLFVVYHLSASSWCHPDNLSGSKKSFCFLPRRSRTGHQVGNAAKTWNLGQRIYVGSSREKSVSTSRSVRSTMLWTSLPVVR